MGLTSRKDLEARANIAAAVAAVFTALGGASFAGLLPKIVLVIAACAALAGLIAVVMFRIEARNVGLELASAEVERARTALERRAPASAVDEVDPTRIGVDPAAQDILPGGRFPNTSGGTSTAMFTRRSRQRLMETDAGWSSLSDHRRWASRGRCFRP
jgi:hypothetical protein